MDLYKQQKMDCMAGIAAASTLQKPTNSNISQTANLNTSSHTTTASSSGSSLWQRQQSSSAAECINANDIESMQQSASNSNNNSNSFSLDDRIPATGNYKTQKQLLTNPRPLTLNVLAIVIMSLATLLMHMPIAANSHPITRDSSSGEQRSMRLCKSHKSPLIITKYLQEGDHNLEWKSPCRNPGQWVNSDEDDRSMVKQKRYHYFKTYANVVRNEYYEINSTANYIPISDMDQWDNYKEVYKFLPTLDENSKFALKVWYNHMQVYVASFGYLARTQYNFDLEKQNCGGDVTEELNLLLRSARSILCELETTIYGSAPSNNPRKLRSISRQGMNNHLKFTSKIQLADKAVKEPLPVDLKFAKYNYFQFLQNMHKILNQKLQNKKKTNIVVDSFEENSIYISKEGGLGNNLDVAFAYNSDSSLSLGDSFELHANKVYNPTTKRPSSQRRRTKKRKPAQMPEA